MTANQFKVIAENISTYSGSAVEFQHYIPSAEKYMTSIGVLVSVNTGALKNELIIRHYSFRHSIHYTNVKLLKLERNFTPKEKLAAEYLEKRVEFDGDNFKGRYPTINELCITFTSRDLKDKIEAVNGAMKIKDERLNVNKKQQQPTQDEKKILRQTMIVYMKAYVELLKKERDSLSKYVTKDWDANFKSSKLGHEISAIGNAIMELER